jgi:VanZ family protein
MYAGILEYLQHFSPGRHPSVGDFAASAIGALCGGLVIALVRRVCLHRDRMPDGVIG